MKSANPMPNTLPALMSVMPSSTIADTNGDSASARPGTQNRPVTFGSSVVPEMSLPPRSMMSTSISLNGSAGTSARAYSVSSCSRSPPTSSAVKASTLTTSPLHDSIDPTPPRRRPVAFSAAIPSSRRSRISIGPHEWIWAAPGCLPKPTTAIFVQPRLDRTLEARVRLDAVDGEDPVGAQRVVVEVHGHAARRRGDDLVVHRGPDLGTDRLLGDAERVEHLQLALGGGPTVAPHRRHDERLGAEVAQPVDRATRQLDALAEPPAPRADGDGHAGSDRRREPFDDRRSGRGLDVGDRVG